MCSGLADMRYTDLTTHSIHTGEHCPIHLPPPPPWVSPSLNKKIQEGALLRLYYNQGVPDE